jgi:hypothetical protein
MASQNPSSNPILSLKKPTVFRLSGEELAEVAGGDPDPDGAGGTQPGGGPSEASSMICHIYCGWWSLATK